MRHRELIRLYDLLMDFSSTEDAAEVRDDLGHVIHAVYVAESAAYDKREAKRP